MPPPYGEGGRGSRSGTPAPSTPSARPPKVASCRVPGCGDLENVVLRNSGERWCQMAHVFHPKAAEIDADDTPLPPRIPLISRTKSRLSAQICVQGEGTPHRPCAGKIAADSEWVFLQISGLLTPSLAPDSTRCDSSTVPAAQIVRDGVAVIHIVFYFSTSPILWGGVMGGPDFGPTRVEVRNGCKEAKGRCEA